MTPLPIIGAAISAISTMAAGGAEAGAEVAISGASMAAQTGVEVFGNAVINTATNVAAKEVMQFATDIAAAANVEALVEIPGASVNSLPGIETLAKMPAVGEELVNATPLKSGLSTESVATTMAQTNKAARTEPVEQHEKKAGEKDKKEQEEAQIALDVSRLRQLYLEKTDLLQAMSKAKGISSQPQFQNDLKNVEIEIAALETKLKGQGKGNPLVIAALMTALASGSLVKSAYNDAQNNK